MAYSGTVGQTVITVQNFIDQGARLAGKLAEELTVEQVQASTTGRSTSRYTGFSRINLSTCYLWVAWTF